MSEAASPAAVPDRWRTGMLMAAVLPLLVLAALLGYDLWNETAEYLADTDLRAVTSTFWYLLLPVASTLAQWLLAVGVVLALVWRRNLPRSRRVLLLVFGASLPLQVLPRLMPMQWQFALGEDLQEQAGAIMAKYAPLSALGGVIDLLPLLISITVGLSRAGLRQLRVRPDDPVGGTVAFVASLQLGLVCSLAFAFLEPLSGSGWLLTGLGMTTSHYAAAALICFLLARRARDRSARWWKLALHLSAFCLLLPGIVEVGIGLCEIEVFDQRLIGWNEGEGILTASKAWSQLLVFTARTLITAIAANDLLERVSDR